MAHPDLVLLLLADSRLPVAGHTQSATLEGALAHGLADVPGYVRTRLAAAVRVEAGTAVAARHAVVAGADVADVERAWAARTVSPALREASRSQGRALARLASRLWPEALAPLAGNARPSRPVVLGVLAAHLGLAAPALARLVAYDDVQTVCAAALKLVPLDPVAVTGWLHDALPDIDAAAQAVAEVRHAEEIPAVSAPQIEEWAQAHAHITRRLFRA